MAQHPLSLSVHGDGVGQGYRRANHIGAGAVPGIRVFNAGHGFVSAAASAEHIAIGPRAAVQLHGNLPGILRCRRTGLIYNGGIRPFGKHGGGTHVGFHEVRAMEQREGNVILQAVMLQGRDLLVRPRERREILEESSPIGVLPGEAENKLDLCSLKAAVNIEKRNFLAIHQCSNAFFFFINHRTRIGGVLQRVINQFLHRIHRLSYRMGSL